MKFELDKAVEILSRTPKTIEQLLAGLSEEWTEDASTDDSWNPFDVIGHYIHGEETDWIPRAEIILSQKPDRKFVPFDRFAQFENSEGKTLGELLERFKGLRELNLRILQDMQLTETELDMTGEHPELGEVTLRELLATWVVHDLTHIRQIVTALAEHYSEEVGPWKEYLSILK